MDKSFFKLSNKVIEGRLIRITSPYFCAAVWLSWHNGRVTEAAPILRYMFGWQQIAIEQYCREKQWEFEYI